MFYSENAKKAKKVVDAFRKGDEESKIFLGVTVRNIYDYPSPSLNPFVFSDGTDFDDGEFPYKWGDNEPGYVATTKCTYLGNNGRVFEVECDQVGKALCAVESTCAESGSERSRANLPIFALFLYKFFEN